MLCAIEYTHDTERNWQLKIIALLKLISGYRLI